MIFYFRGTSKVIVYSKQKHGNKKEEEKRAIEFESRDQ